MADTYDATKDDIYQDIRILQELHRLPPKPVTAPAPATSKTRSGSGLSTRMTVSVPVTQTEDPERLSLAELKARYNRAQAQKEQ